MLKVTIVRGQQIGLKLQFKKGTISMAKEMLWLINRPNMAFITTYM